MKIGSLKFNYWHLLVVLVLLLSLRDFSAMRSAEKEISYSDFQQALKEGSFSEIVITDQKMAGLLKEPQGALRRFRTTRVEPELAKELQNFGVKFSQVAIDSFWSDLLAWLVPLLLLAGLWLLFVRTVVARGGLSSGLMAVGKSKAKIYVETDTKITFADVAGADEAKVELKEVVEFLKDPEKFSRLGSRLPKGILLIGPPGTGKTLVARAIAGEAGVPFFSTNGAEFVEMFVGVGAARVRDLFEQAKLRAPCIIFIDELDALGKVRLGGVVHSNDEKEQTLNQLLVELDGFDARSGIVLLAATNRPEILDPALLRSGRFDRQVLLDRPDKDGRLDILLLHVKRIKTSSSLNLEQVAAMTPGLTGADLANLVNEASLVALRRHAEAVSDEDFTAAIERMLTGLEKKNRLINPKERRIVAYHEVGHAIVGAVTLPEEPANKISIIPRGVSALGYTLRNPTEERFLMTRAELEAKVAMLLGGRAAESLAFEHESTGSADDLDKATEIAWSAVTRFGMAVGLGLASYERRYPGYLGDSGGAWRARDYSDQTARDIDCAVADFVQRSFVRAKDILEFNRILLDEMAEDLIRKEVLSGVDLETYLKRAKSITLALDHGARVRSFFEPIQT